MTRTTISCHECGAALHPLLGAVIETVLAEREEELNAEGVSGTRARDAGQRDMARKRDERRRAVDALRRFYIRNGGAS